MTPTFPTVQTSTEQNCGTLLCQSQCSNLNNGPGKHRGRSTGDGPGYYIYCPHRTQLCTNILYFRVSAKSQFIKKCLCNILATRVQACTTTEVRVQARLHRSRVRQDPRQQGSNMPQQWRDQEFAPYPPGHPPAQISGFTHHCYVSVALSCSVFLLLMTFSSRVFHLSQESSNFVSLFQHVISCRVMSRHIMLLRVMSCSSVAMLFAVSVNPVYCSLTSSIRFPML